MVLNVCLKLNCMVKIWCSNATVCSPTRLVRILLSRQTQRDGAHSALCPLWPVDSVGRQVCARSSLGKQEQRTSFKVRLLCS